MFHANLILGSRLSFLSGYFKNDIIDFFLIPLQGFHSSLVLTDSIRNSDRWLCGRFTRSSWFQYITNRSTNWIFLHKLSTLIKGFLHCALKIFHHLGVFKELIPLGSLFETLEGIGNLCLLASIYREQQLIRFNESSKLFYRHLILFSLFCKGTFLTNFHHRTAITTQGSLWFPSWVTLSILESFLLGFRNGRFGNLTVSINERLILRANFFRVLHDFL